MSNYLKPINRLNLRLICRSTDWFQKFDNLIRLDYFKEAEKIEIDEENDDFEQDFVTVNNSTNSEKIFYLTGIRLFEVQAAAESENISFEDFYKFIVSSSAEVFLSNPVTLKALFNIYREEKPTGKITISRNDLYEKVVKLKCCELDDRNKILFHKPGPGVEEKYKVSQYLAIRMLFEDKNSIYTEADMGNVPDNNIVISKLASEIWKEFDIRSTLLSGLFCPQLPDSNKTLGWSQRGLWDFCAAKFLSETPIKTEKLAKLITSSITGKVYTQLHFTSSLLIAYRKDLFETLVEKDPLVVLRADLTVFDDCHRDKLTSAILKQTEHGLLDRLIRSKDIYSKLKTVNTANILKEYLIPEQPLKIKIIAVEIVRACCISELDHNLIELFKASSDRYLEIQARIMNALVKSPHKATIVEIKKYLTNDPCSEQELKGIILNQLWPSVLTAEEVLSALKFDGRKNYFGAFKTFLFSDFLKHFKSEDLYKVLNWLAEDAPGKKKKKNYYVFLNALLSSDYPDVINFLVRCFNESSEDKNCKVALANLIITDYEFASKLNHYNDEKQSALKKLPKDKTQAVFNELVSIIDNTSETFLGNLQYSLVWSTNILDASDLKFLGDLIQNYFDNNKILVFLTDCLKSVLSRNREIALSDFKHEVENLNKISVIADIVDAYLKPKQSSIEVVSQDYDLENESHEAIDTEKDLTKVIEAIDIVKENPREWLYLGRSLISKKGKYWLNHEIILDSKWFKLDEAQKNIFIESLLVFLSEIGSGKEKRNAWDPIQLYLRKPYNKTYYTEAIIFGLKGLRRLPQNFIPKPEAV